MQLRFLIIPVLMLTLLVPVLSSADDADSSSRFIATYFLTNVRCPSCLSIERLTSETIQMEFAEQIESGILEWRTINIDEKGNFHFVKDYNLYTKSVIISEEVKGKEVRWKNLPKVWELLRNESKFRKYLKGEMSSFMAGP
jgi:hypothetical protein